MVKNLVIVESPAKAKTIEKFLGSDYKVMSSYGHIRDLKPKSFSIDVDNDFAPIYEIPADKEDVVAALRKAASEAQTVWLASDEDREGEAIAWHLAEVLGLDIATTRRIVFHEITKKAILKALENPRTIDLNRVDAQQARRVLDRIVGFEVSPVLWRKVMPSLSAGRVQSVAVRLIVEREREIAAFVSEPYFRVNTTFATPDGDTFRGEYSHRLPSEQDARKLGFSVSQTMMLAQKLYEAGHITYMRTDSLNLSDDAVKAISDEIVNTMGASYLNLRQYHTQSKGAQEAHEAIRPTDVTVTTPADCNDRERRLYTLIRQRAIASQMADAEFEKTTAEITSPNAPERFAATGEVVIFDGFLKVYAEGRDEEGEAPAGMTILPHLAVGMPLTVSEMTATERFTQQPPRYTEASLVKKMEELGIGRPSTYAPTISTIQNREYIERGENEGTPRPYTVLHLEPGDQIATETRTETIGSNKGKLIPTDIGVVVNDFLTQYFPEILDYNFTANAEERFDDIAEGKMQWNSEMRAFYDRFHPQVKEAMDTRLEQKTGERLLGTDPEGKPVSVKIGRFGPLVQIGVASDEQKPRFASLLKGQSMSTITLEEALKLFEFPRILGTFEDKDVEVAIGRFGPYVRHNSKFVSIPKEITPAELTLDQAIALIKERRSAEAGRIVKTFDEDPDLQILNGPYGVYIAYKGKNYKLPKTVTEPAELTLEQAKEIIEAQPARTSRRTSTRKAKK